MSSTGDSVPSQPRLDQAYEVAGNPTDKEPIEEARARDNAKADAVPSTADHRDASSGVDDSQATATSMARGVRGAGPGEEAAQGWTQDAGVAGRADDAEEQMAAPGEGQVASAVARHSGGAGGEPGLEKDLDRKKAAQAPARHEVQEHERRDFDVGGVLGQRGGAADPVDKNGYPNAGDS